jgi:hypothetical protein
VGLVFEFRCLPQRSLGQPDRPESTDPRRPVSVSTPRVPLDTLLERLQDKLGRLHAGPGRPFALVGSVYLDVLIRPIVTTVLGKDEWINIDPIGFALGGSGLWVGKYLHQFYGQQSHLFSLVGKSSDLFTQEFTGLMGLETGWLAGNHVKRSSRGRTPVTVHLIQSNNEFTTMFTHTGALSDFGWDDIQQELERTLEQGGVLYISGYLKTSLHVALSANLARFADNTLICIDHGRLRPEHVNGVAMDNLVEAFRQGRIDVYFCTYRELLSFYRARHSEELVDTGDIKDTLRHIQGSGILPALTIVRDKYQVRNSIAYAIVGESVYSLRGEGGPTVAGACVGPKNAFSAGMVHQLIHGLDPHSHSLGTVVRDAGKEALARWYSAPNIKWDPQPEAQRLEGPHAGPDGA